MFKLGARHDLSRAVFTVSLPYVALYLHIAGCALLIPNPTFARESSGSHGPPRLKAQSSPTVNKGQSAAKGGEAKGDKGKGEKGDGEEASPDTEDMFGFTLGTDTLEKERFEVSTDAVSSLGKRFGRYQADSVKSTFTFAPVDGLSIEPGLVGNRFSIRNVPDLDNRSFTGFGGSSVQIKWQALKRGPSPFGLTLMAEPSIGFLDANTGERGRVQDLEARLLLDTALIPNTLYAAFNTIYELNKFRPRGVRLFSSEGEELEAPLRPCSARLPKGNGTPAEGEEDSSGMQATGSADEDREPCAAFARRKSAERSSTLGFSGALAFQAIPNVFLGAEVRYLRAYEGLTLQHFRGEAVFVGPTFYTLLGNHLGITVGFSTQVAGHAVGVPGRLDLDHFSRHQARLKIFYEF